jgi:hypothetical protein
LKGDVEINACPSFSLKVLEGRSPKVTVKDYNGVFLSSATITSALTVTGTDCEKFLKLDFTDIVIDIPPASYFVGGGGGSTTFTIDQDRIDIKTIGGEASRQWTALSDGPYLRQTGNELQLSGTLSPPYFGCGDSQTDDGDMVFRTLNLEELDVTLLKKNSCCSLPSENEINICDGSLFMTCSNQADPNIIDLCASDPNASRPTLKFSGVGSISYIDDYYNTDLRAYHMRVAEGGTNGARNYASLELNYSAGGLARLNIQNNATYSTQLAGNTFYQGDSLYNYIQFPGPDNDNSAFRIVIRNDDVFKTVITGSNIYTGIDGKNASISPGDMWIKQSNSSYARINGANVYITDDGGTTNTNISPGDIYVVDSNSAFTRIQSTNLYLTSDGGTTNTSISPAEAYFKKSATDYTKIDGGTIYCNAADGTQMSVNSNDLWLKDSSTSYTHLDANTIYTTSSPSENSSITPGKATIKKSSGYTDIDGATLYVGNGGVGANNDSISIGIASGAHVEVTDGTSGGKLSGNNLYVYSGSDSTTVNSNHVFVNNSTGESTLGASSLTLNDNTNTGGYYTSSLSLTLGSHSTVLNTNNLYIEKDSAGACTLGVSSLSLSDGTNSGNYNVADLTVRKGTKSVTIDAATPYVELSSGTANVTKLSYGALAIHDGTNKADLAPSSLTVREGTKSAAYKATGIDYNDANLQSQLYAGNLWVKTDSTNYTHIAGSRIYSGNGSTASVDISGLNGTVEATAGTLGGKLTPGSLSVYSSASVTSALTAALLTLTSGVASSTLGPSSLELGSGTNKGNYNIGDFTIRDIAATGKYVSASAGDPSLTLGVGIKTTKLSYGALSLNDGTNIANFTPKSIILRDGAESTTYGVGQFSIANGSGSSATVGATEIWSNISGTNYTKITGASIYSGDGSNYSVNIEGTLGKLGVQQGANIGVETLPTYLLVYNNGIGASNTINASSSSIVLGSASSSLGPSSLSLSTGTDTGNYNVSDLTLRKGTNTITASADTKTLEINDTSTSSKSLLKGNSLRLEGSGSASDYTNSSVTVRGSNNRSVAISTGTSPNILISTGTISSTLGTSSLELGTGTITGAANYNIADWTIRAGLNTYISAVASSTSNILISASGVSSTLGTLSLQLGTGSTNAASYNVSDLSINLGSHSATLSTNSLYIEKDSAGACTLGVSSLSLSDGTNSGNYNVADLTVRKGNKYVTIDSNASSLALHNGGQTGTYTNENISLAASAGGSIAINSSLGNFTSSVGTKTSTLGTSSLSLSDGANTGNYNVSDLTLRSGTKTITLDAASLPSSASFQQITICVNGTNRTAWVLMTTPS